MRSITSQPYVYGWQNGASLTIEIADIGIFIDEPLGRQYSVKARSALHYRFPDAVLLRFEATIALVR